MDVKPPTNAEGDKSPTRIKKRIRGVTPIYLFIEAARSLFAQLGNVVEVTSESDFNLFSAATGTIAAHFAYLAQISDWLTSQGIASLAARQYVAAIFGEISTSLQGINPDFQRLSKEHATPGGINERFCQILSDEGVWKTVGGALTRPGDSLATDERELIFDVVSRRLPHPAR